ncbi:hypothetical protein [Herbiconiux daphne]|uniref:Uncharacterized protein n=1 Tax=Herbiconiux daphne TaxID=2970914 RepID=A0ABT2HBH4_9MICO|nr:hypothetical protein [Herbiconiux daphne]MCS5737299.1 hypothetical protein [Herbiconiux daphne]
MIHFKFSVETSRHTPLKGVTVEPETAAEILFFNGLWKEGKLKSFNGEIHTDDFQTVKEIQHHLEELKRLGFFKNVTIRATQDLEL